MKRFCTLLLTLLFATTCLQIDAGSGKYWGIGLGSAAAGYTAGRLHGRSKRQREPRYQETRVVHVAPSNNLTQELENERARNRRLENDLEDERTRRKRLEDDLTDVERENKRLRQNIEELEEKNDKLKEQFQSTKA